MPGELPQVVEDSEVFRDLLALLPLLSSGEKKRVCKISECEQVR